MFAYLIRVTVVLAIVSAVFVIANRLLLAMHQNAMLWSGWFLFTCIMFLAAYNVRKKLVITQFVPSKLWLKAHLVVAVLVIPLYVLHAGWQIPHGATQRILAALWLLTMISGIIGLILTRTIPRVLTSIGDEVLFEVIPVHRAYLKSAAEDLAVDSLERTGYTSVASYFTDYVRDFFDGNQNTFRHILGQSTAAENLLRHIEAKKRYLNPEEREILTEISGFAIQKDKLDRHYALQLILRIWLFVHIPCTYALITTTLLHIFLVYAFSGAAL